jgi:hypothetical protein
MDEGSEGVDGGMKFLGPKGYLFDLKTDLRWK